MNARSYPVLVWERIQHAIACGGFSSGIPIALRAQDPCGGVLAVLGPAGSGKTKLLCDIHSELIDAGVKPVADEPQTGKPSSGRSVAVLAPTNKAASVLRARSVPATTLHRILYTPLYDPDYEAIAKWLGGRAGRPEATDLTDAQLDRAKALFEGHGSVPAALAATGLRGSDFIKGWQRRADPLDIGLVDEASMLEPEHLSDLRKIFGTLVLFGDPAQLPPVGGGGEMAFEALPEEDRVVLSRVHRQGHDSPILELSDILTDPKSTFDVFEQALHDAAARDPRIEIARQVDTDAITRVPILVWRNATRIRIIQGFRRAFELPDEDLAPGEPLICDGLELPAKHRRRRIDLEARGVIKGAQAIYRGGGKKRGFARIHLVGADESDISVASIIKIERVGEAEPFLPMPARMGAAFVHGAAVTIHKAQGSQWPRVQVFGPDIFAAAQSGRTEAGVPLWKRLAYVAITRAEVNLVWVTRYALARPKHELTTQDLRS